MFAELSQAWANRFYIDPDGVNYLDIANAYLRHDWRNAISAHWSPLWTWLLALALWLVRPSPFWESTVLHAVNFFVYLLALLSFAFFLNELMALCFGQTEGSREAEGLTSFAWLVLAYATAAHVFLFMIGGILDTPDLCVAALFILATALLIRLRRGHPGWQCYAILGATLGTAYLAKTVMFPLAFVFLFCALLTVKNLKQAIPGVLLALLVFVIFSGPFIIVLSVARGRFTFGDSGRLAYIVYVKGTSPIYARLNKLSEDPLAYEFSTPIKGTFPPYYDPTYWNEGIRPQFNWRAQFHRLAVGGHEYFKVLSSQRALAVGILVLVFFDKDWRSFLRRFTNLWTIWLPAFSTVLLYLIVYLEPRYLPAATLVLWCSLLAAIWLPRLDASARLANSVAIAVALVLGFSVVSSAVANLTIALGRPPHVEWQVADGLHRMGLRPGDTVAVLGQEVKADYWAHLAQVRVIADLPYEAMDRFWQASDDKQASLLDAFARTGAKILVTRFKPPSAHSDGWQNLENTGYFALPLWNRTDRKLEIPAQ